jgi:hypothetical protein
VGNFDDQLWGLSVIAITPAFARETRPQSVAVAASDRADEDQAFIDALGLDHE